MFKKKNVGKRALKPSSKFFNCSILCFGNVTGTQGGKLKQTKESYKKKLKYIN